MEVHAHTHSPRKKMDTLFLGIPDAVPCRVLRIPGGISTGT